MWVKVLLVEAFDFRINTLIDFVCQENPSAYRCCCSNDSHLAVKFETFIFEISKITVDRLLECIPTIGV
jgi:hypothetical protein